MSQGESMGAVASVAAAPPEYGDSAVIMVFQDPLPRKLNAGELVFVRTLSPAEQAEAEL